jgi:hypothetical protein
MASAFVEENELLVVDVAAALLPLTCEVETVNEAPAAVSGLALKLSVDGFAWRALTQPNSCLIISCRLSNLSYLILHRNFY